MERKTNELARMTILYLQCKGQKVARKSPKFLLKEGKLINYKIHHWREFPEPRHRFNVCMSIKAMLKNSKHQV